MRSLEEIELLDIENDEKYQNYYNKLINTLNQTTIENSIIFEFEIKENICLCKIEKYEVNGSHQMIQTQEFSKIEKVIDRIIKPFLSVFNKKNKIIIHTITPTHGTKSNLKLITENNDMCNIKNLEDLKEVISDINSLGKAKKCTLNFVEAAQIDFCLPMLKQLFKEINYQNSPLFCLQVNYLNKNGFLLDDEKNLKLKEIEDYLKDINIPFRVGQENFKFKYKLEDQIKASKMIDQIAQDISNLSIENEDDISFGTFDQIYVYDYPAIRALGSSSGTYDFRLNAEGYLCSQIPMHYEILLQE